MGIKTKIFYSIQRPYFLSAILCLCMGGCSYSSDLKHENITHSLDDSHRVGLTGKFDSENSSLVPIDGDWSATSVKLRTDELQPVLQEYVHAIFDIPLDNDRPQVLIEVDFEEHPVVTRELAGHVVIRVKKASDGAELFKAESSFVVPVEYSAGAGVSDFMSGFTLGLSTPLTIPTRTASQGSLARKRTEKKLQTIFNQIFKEMAEAKRRLHYALGREPGESDDSGIRNIGSKYDPYLDAVFVVNSGNVIGSGFFVSPNGLALTNEHVVRGHDRVSIRLRDRSVVAGSVLLVDKASDIALLKIDRRPRAWLKMEDLGDTGVGEELLVIGTPEGLDWSMSRGIVSQLRESSDGSIWVQTDAALNPGNSGGPMISSDSGEVVGIATFALTQGDDSGLNFGIHSETVINIFHELRPYHRDEGTDAKH